MENPAALGKIFRRSHPFGKQDFSGINHFRVGMPVAFTLRLLRKGGPNMTSVANAGSYLRPTPAYTSRALTRADALPEADEAAGAAAGNAKQGIPVSALKAIDMSGVKAVSVADLPEIRDMMAKHWLDTQAANATWATAVPDNAPQNTYATVKVNGKVVATLYNGGSAAMTNQAAAMVGDLQDAAAPNGGPDLAQWRAERIAKAVGGTVEKASTAITQSAWKPRETTSSNYTRAQLDAAFEAMMAEQQKAVAQRTGGYANPGETSRGLADVNA